MPTTLQDAFPRGKPSAASAFRYSPPSFRAMQILAGTSGWAYHEWKGSFYPADLPANRMLAYYADRFPSVEVNNTFYRMPREHTLLEWAAAVSHGFRFCIKASRRITHDARLANAEAELDYFFCAVAVLGDRRGPTLFQLPPDMHNDVPRLRAFLRVVPRTWPAAIEWRRPSWFDDEVYELLRERGVALGVAEHQGDPTPLVPTASWGYLRLHGSDYDHQHPRNWAARRESGVVSRAYRRRVPLAAALPGSIFGRCCEAAPALQQRPHQTRESA